MPLLQIDDLQTYFDTREGVVKAVDGVSLQLERGQTLGLVGESGSGKSVLSLSVMQLIGRPAGRFAGGRVLFEGIDLLQRTDREMEDLRGNRLAMIFQDPMTALNPFLTVQSQLTEVLQRHRGMTSQEARQRAVEMLERVGIGAAAQRMGDYPHQFSGGMRQRVMIAMALLCQPALLIADEPTTALDVTIAAQILALMRELQRDLGTAIVLITHDFGVVAGMADRIAVMYAGRIVEEAAPQALYGAPRHPYSHGLLQCVPRLDSPIDRPLVPIAGLPPNLAALPPGCAFTPRCPRRTAQCAVTYPPQTPVGADHWSRCWHPHDAGSSHGVLTLPELNA